MKVLNFSLDKLAADPHSAVARRIASYGRITNRYDVIVPADEADTVSLGPQVVVHAVRRSGKLMTLWRIYRLSFQLAQRHSYDVVSVQDTYYLAVLAWLVARRFQAGLEVQVHGFEKYNGMRKYLAGFTLRRANAVRVVSKRLKIKLVQDFAIDEASITVVPIQVSDAVRTTQLKKHSTNTGPFTFLTVGRLVPVKNMSMQIEAFAEIINTHPNARLWIAGEGKESNKLKVASNKLELKENVRFLGWRDDLSNVYEKADCFVLSSHSEGWGMAVVEAAARGLPIIMTDVGLAGEVIKDHVSGLVIPVGDVHALAQAMKVIMEDVSLRTRLAQGARQAIADLPDAAQTLELYRQSWDNAVN